MAVENLIADSRTYVVLNETTRAMPTHPGVNCFASTVQVSAGASVGSTYLLARLPGDVRIAAQSVVCFEALSTGASTLMIGTFDLGEKAADDEESLHSGLDVTAKTINAPFLSDVTAPSTRLTFLAGGPFEKTPDFINIRATIRGADCDLGGRLTCSIIYHQE